MSSETTTTTTTTHDRNSVTGKCPCCNNPWSNGNDFFAKLCITCEPTTTSENNNNNNKTFGLSRRNMDFTIHPKDNFYRYANGTWLDENPIPKEYPNWNSFLQLHTQSQENLKGILEGLLQKKNNNDEDEDNNNNETTTSSATDEEQKVALFYQAAMNEDAIEQVGFTPLQPVLDICNDIAKHHNSTDNNKSLVVAKGLGTVAYSYGIHPFMGMSVSPDKKDSDHSIPQLSQGGLGMPDRDYYFDESKEEIRTKYKECIAKLMKLVLLHQQQQQQQTQQQQQQGGDNNHDTEKVVEVDNKVTMAAAVAAATRILDLETLLAEAHMTKTENRDPVTTYNKMTLHEITTDLCNDQFDFLAFFTTATGNTKTTTHDAIGNVNVRNVEALKRVAQVMSTVEHDTLVYYLYWMVLKSCAPYLTKECVQIHFDFYSTTLQGTVELKPRWKRAMEFTESAALGEALGKLYCRQYFDETSKERALIIVEQVRQALEDRLKEVDWIKADSTREQALLKMNRFGIKIGYPDEWKDYSTLYLDPKYDFLTMVFKARQFEAKEELKEFNAPTNKKKWFMNPQTVNAYYHPNLNEIVFPAAILQHPFFDKDADDAVNFGAMGAVIGHEMTHGFDDKGRKFDYKGTLNDWWTESDSQEYERRLQVMVEQANEFEVHGERVQGKLTSGENIADLGGLRLALRALRATPGFDESTKIDGFTPIQRFFLSWAQCWRQNITKERSLQLLTIDPHGPNEMRCNGPLSNIPEFHAAFEVGENDFMYKPPEARVNIW